MTYLLVVSGFSFKDEKIYQRFCSEVDYENNIKLNTELIFLLIDKIAYWEKM